MDGTFAMYYRARYYDHQIGRFISEDPTRWQGGSENFYHYVRSNPLTYVDPSGLWLTYNGNLNNYANAISYLRRGQGMASTIDYLAQIPVYIEITETNAPCGSPAAGSFDSSTNELRWNPHSAYFCETGLNTLSPACVLGHELAHAALLHRIGRQKSDELFNHKDPRYGNLNETYVIAGPENNFELQMGECVRSSHRPLNWIIVPTPSER